MLTFKQYILEDIHKVDHDKEYGKSFRYAKTPKDQPGEISIVTPENEGAWKDWKPVSNKTKNMMKSNWQKQRKQGTLHKYLAPHKASQILKHSGK